MNQETKRRIAEAGVLERPTYTEEDFKVLHEKLQFIVNPPESSIPPITPKDSVEAFYIRNTFITFDFNPILLEGWADQTNEDYDYKAIMFTNIDRLPLLLNEQLNPIEDLILKWRLERNK